MSKTPDHDEHRKRVVGGNLSPWHFGARIQPERNKIAEVNTTGSRFALNPNDEDAEKLVRYFHSYILKYVGLLKNGRFIDNKGKVAADTKRFLALFMPAQATKGDGATKRMKEIAERLTNAFISMDHDDVYNELVTLFFELARRFNPDIGGFTGYIGHHFKFAVKTRMFQVQKDPLNYQPLYDELSTSDPSADQAADLEELDEMYQQAPEFRDIANLDFSFISMPPEPFGEIWTKLQRRIIVHFYCEDMSFSQISQKLGLGSAANVRTQHDEALEAYRTWSDISIIGGE